MARSPRSDIKIGSLEKKLGLAEGAIRNPDGSNARSDKLLKTLRKEYQRVAAGPPVRISASVKAAAASAQARKVAMKPTPKVAISKPVAKSKTVAKVAVAKPVAKPKPIAKVAVAKPVAKPKAVAKVAVTKASTKPAASKKKPSGKSKK